MSKCQERTGGAPVGSDSPSPAAASVESAIDFETYRTLEEQLPEARKALREWLAKLPEEWQRLIGFASLEAVHVDGAPGWGFKVDLRGDTIPVGFPPAPDDTQLRLVSGGPDFRPLPKPLILIVEDEQDELESHADVLKGEFGVLPVDPERPVESAREIWLAFPGLRLVLADWKLNGNGASSGALLREFKSREGARVIVCSAFLDERDVREGLTQIGVDLVLEKPVEPQVLRTRIRELAMRR